MIINDKSVDVQSNFEFDEEEEMGISGAAKAIVIKHLISAYGLPETACLREYTSNARDSHIEAGVTRPVEVTTPSALAQSLTVRDYGVGLSRQELKMFGQFGESSKRDTNDQIGGFGIGSKS
jgi:HSP90 family molecular chaperone